MEEKKFCNNCQTLRAADYGKLIKAGKINRWRCTACLERTNTPLYKGGKK